MAEVEATGACFMGKLLGSGKADCMKGGKEHRARAWAAACCCWWATWPLVK